ncbi:UNVERIFIED_CONTAM: hypothetical protein GTU68_062964 [Idotea baltica]|nr:hypothetical protein [Idotea baltica]
MESNPPRVNKWDANAVKNALDDAVKDVLISKFKYSECHKLVDGRLAISTVAVSFSLFALLWDYLYPFPLSRTVLCICVVSYFLMMGILSWYTSYVEQGIFCTTLNKDPAGFEPVDVWNAMSSLKRFDHLYHLGLEEKVGKSGEKKEARITMPIEKYFDDSGKLLYDRVAKEVERLHSDIKHKKN